MPVITIDDCALHYELAGVGPTLALTPGGRRGGDAIRYIADSLASHFRVLLWDRRNTGRSTVWFGSEPEQLVWADDLAALLKWLDIGPAYLAGASAGARVSYLTAIRHPRVVAGLALWSVSGGPYASQVLGYQYHSPYIDAARIGGMAGVAATPFFEERIEANPENQSRLMSTPPEKFIAALQSWNASFFFRPDCPVLGATADDLRSIACPTLVVEGNDDVHTAEASQAFHAYVPNSTLVPSPWTTEEWFDYATGRISGTPMALYRRVVPLVVDFLGTLPR